MSGTVIFIVAALYAMALFALAFWAKSPRMQNNGAPRYSNRLRFIAYNLALAVFCTSWTFYGAVGTAVAEGWNYLPIYLGPILLFGFATPFLERLIEAVKFENATSISHFIGSRFSNSRGIAALVTILALLGIVPYLALQLRSVGTSYARLSGAEDIVGPMAITAVTLTLFATVFGTRTYDSASRNDGVLFAISVESIVKLAAFISIGVFAIFVFLKAPAASQNFALGQMLNNFSPANLSIDFFVFGALAAVAIICLPRQFYIGIIQSNASSDISNARTGFITYLLLTTLIVLPIALASFAIMPGGKSADMLVIDMPLHQGFNSLALFVFVGGFSAATGMVMVETIALSTMVSNDLIAPILLQNPRWSKNANFGETMLLIRRLTIFALMAIAFIYASLIPDSSSLATIGLIGFAAVAQFAPVLIMAVYSPNRDPIAAKSALVTGLVVWAYTLLLPTILPQVILHPLEGTLFNPYGLFGFNGLSPITHGTLWSIGANLFVHFLTSARKLQVPRILIEFGSKVRVGKVTTKNDLLELVRRFVGEEQTNEHFASIKDIHAPIDRATAREAERLIASVIGAPSARALMSSALSGSSLTISDVAQMLDYSGQSLRFSKDILAATLEHIDPGVSVIDRHQRLVAWNSRYLDLFNYPPGMVRVGAPVADLIRYNAMHGECGPGEVENHVERRLNHMRRRQRHSFERVREDGRVFKTVGGPMPGGGYVSCFTDITAEARARQALEKARGELERRVDARTKELKVANKALSQAASDKTRFLAAASHDLLQPLHAARLFTSALDRKIEAQNKQLLHNIDQSIEGAEKLLRRLLDISKLDAGGIVPQPRDMSVKEKCQEIINLLTPVALEKGLKLKFVAGDLWVNTDPTLFRSIVQNLVSNAIKYTSNGGVLLGVRKRGKTVSIEVYDTGEGIPQSYQEKIFREFERLPREVEPGMGLGLSIVERTARLIGGKIDLKSIEDQGSRFSLSLPLIKKPEDGEKTKDDEIRLIKTDTPKTTTNKKKFLIVDDDARVRNGMNELISALGYDFDIAGSYEEAIAKNDGTYNAMLLDYELGGDKNGLDLAQELLKTNPNAKAAIITAKPIEVAQAQALELGIDIFRKPLKAKFLTQWIDENL